MPETFSCIYLASASPRRRELLRQIGVNFKRLRPSKQDVEVDETPLPGEIPERYVERLAIAKASNGAERLICRKLPKYPVLAADTAIDLDGAIIGKPADSEEARRILLRLSGRSHRVLTAIAISDGQTAQSRLSISEVSFRPLTEEDIRRYIATNEPMDKAGAYAIQGHAAAFITKISGSYSGIMGLPLFETAALLNVFGYRK